MAAEYYARKRGVPARQICYLQTKTVEQISRLTYEQEIAFVVRDCLRNARLTEKILYLVTTQGVPLAIQGSLGETGEAASVDSELTLLYAQIKGAKYSPRGPIPNPFFGRVGSPFDRRQFPIYMVTRLAGYDFAGIRGLIDRALAAANRGMVILDQRNYGVPEGDEWLRDAAIRLPAGRVILEDTAAVVYGKRDVIGYASWGSNDRSRKKRFLGFQFLPGAIATEYVSTNARSFERPPLHWELSTWNAEDKDKWFHGSPQTMTADLVQEGVTGVSGHVFEPFLKYCPRPDYLLPAYVARGRNLAESFYVSIPALSWMNVVIGDPLCRIGPAR
jgi:uncharacterized protein (TIGR03790 family)